MTVEMIPLNLMQDDFLFHNQFATSKILLLNEVCSNLDKNRVHLNPVIAFWSPIMVNFLLLLAVSQSDLDLAIKAKLLQPMCGVICTKNLHLALYNVLK